MTDEMILVPRAELLAWAKAWQNVYDPNDGTDCVTPFDTYLLKSPVEVPPCGCGEATCTVPWEPGCGLGKSEQHVEAQPSPYNRKRIAWELERTAMGDGYYGNALYVAKDFPEATPSVRSLLDRWATGKENGLSDRTDLCAFALQIYAADEESPRAVVGVVQGVRALSARWKSKVIDGEPVSDAQHIQLVVCAAMLDSLLDNLAQQPPAEAQAQGGGERVMHYRKEMVARCRDYAAGMADIGADPVDLEAALAPLLDTTPPSAPVGAYTYASTQATKCAGCGEHKHTPLRIDAMGGYVCLTCIDQKLGSLLGEFGYTPSAPVGVEGLGLRDALLSAKAKLSEGEWGGLCRIFREQDDIIRAQRNRLAQRPEAVDEMGELVGLLDEVRSHFTRDDDLPDDLLPRIDAALAGQQGGVE